MLSDLRYALRQLAKTPGFTTVALLTLALGIGANTAIFSVVQSVLLKPLPYPHPEQLAVLWEDETNFQQASIAWPDLLDWQRQNHAFSAVGGYRRDSFTLTGAGEPEMLQGSRVSASFFDAIKLPAELGRVFNGEEDKVGAPAVAVLGHGLWQRKFGGRTDVIGESVTLNGEPYTIIGVLPAEFGTPTRTDFWTQLGRLGDTANWQTRGNHPGIYAIGRMKPGFTFQTALADLKTISARIAQENPDTSTGVTAAGQLLFENAVGSYRRGLIVLLASVSVVLLIACANLANLLLARSAAREQELAIRTALGASRARLVRQLLLESMLLAIAGAGLGVLLASWARHGIVALSPAGVSRFQEVAIDGRVLLATSLLAILTGFLFGLWPAWRATKTSVRSALASGGRTGSDGPGASRAREILIVGEVALTLMLLVGAGLLLRSFERIQQAELGFDGHDVLTARVALPAKSYANADQIRAFNDRLLERLGAVPGVARADLATNSPLNTGWQTSWHVPGTAPWPAGQNPLAEMNVVSDGYFGTLGIPVVRGRAFGPEDTATGAKVAIIDQAFADRAFPGVDPVGKQVQLGGSTSVPQTIVGVVRTLKVYGYGTEPTLVQAYLPIRQSARPSYMILIKAKGGAAALTTTVRRAVAEIDPNQPLYDIRTMADRIEGSFATPRLYTFLLAIFAGLALLLASIGLYGVLAFQVSRRTREFGIRMALGALHGQVMALVIRRGLSLLGIGIALGLAGALGLGRLLGSLLYRTSWFDAGVIGGVTTLLASIALLASWLPARRALKVDPLVALRAE